MNRVFSGKSGYSSKPVRTRQLAYLVVLPEITISGITDFGECPDLYFGAKSGGIYVSYLRRKSTFYSCISAVNLLLQVSSWHALGVKLCLCLFACTTS